MSMQGFFEDDGSSNANPTSGGDDFDDNDGWGVDSDVYTTKLNTSNLTEEQIQMAIHLEQQIMKERAGSSSAGYEYEYTEEEEPDPYYDMPPPPQNYGGSGSAMPEPLPNSTEEALQLLAQRKQQQQRYPQQPQQFQQPYQQQPQRRYQQQTSRGPQRAVAPIQQPRQPRPAKPKLKYGTSEDEVRAYHELCKQYSGVQAKLARLGEPSPAQKKSFLQNLTRGLIRCLRYPVPEVRSAISSMFLEIGWDVRRNRSPPSVKTPPTGNMLKELLAKTVDFFGARHNLPKRGKYLVRRQQPQAQSNRNQRQNERGGSNRRVGRNQGRGRGQGRSHAKNRYNYNPQHRQQHKPYIHRNRQNAQARKPAGPPRT